MALFGASWLELVLLTGAHSSGHRGSSLLDLTSENLSTLDPNTADGLRSFALNHALRHMDHGELATLKALQLFRPDIPQLHNRICVEKVQDQAQLMLQQYVYRRGFPPTRFGRLILLLCPLRALATTVEGLYVEAILEDEGGERDINQFIRRLISAP